MDICSARCLRLERRIVHSSAAMACSTDRSVNGAVCVAARTAAYASIRARRLARRLARESLRWMVRIETGPASCPTAGSRRFGGWFDVCRLACPTACVYHFDWRLTWWLARRLARVASVDLHFGGWFDSRRARRHTRQLARDTSADGSTHARQRTRWLEYIVSIRDGPGSLPDGSLVS